MMAPQRAGQKRKLVEVPRPATDSEAEDSEFSGQLNGALEDAGDSEEFGDSDEDLAEVLVSDEDDLDSDEILSSDEGDDDENLDVKAKPLNGETSRRLQPPPSELMGSETARDISEISPVTKLVPLQDGKEEDAKPNFRMSLDANGNPRYLYDEIDPVYDSDDSDAAAATNTIGNIPLSYYDAYPHIGYDVNGKKLLRPAKGAALDSLLDSIDIPEGWTGLTDPNSGKPLQLSTEELDTLKKLTRNEAPGDGYDPYPDMVEYFTGKGMEEIMPLSAAPEPKRRFVPSVHEHKRVMKMVKAIKEGRIQPFRQPTEEDREREEAEDYASYDIWSNEQPRPDHPMNIPAPKLPPPGYEESYHPPPEYLPDKKERREWEQQDEEDRDRNFLPEDHAALRKVPGYAKLLKEKFERCLDLYLAPRVRRSKLNIDPESLLPKLPDPQELKPFPTTCSTIYRGHEGRVRSVAIDPTGKYLASGGDDGTVRVWELGTGAQFWRVKLSQLEAVNVVSWRPGADACVLAACCGDSVFFMLPQGDFCSPEMESQSREILDAGFGHTASSTAKKTATGADKPSSATWLRPSAALQERGVLLTLSLRIVPKTMTWHRRGDYFATVSPSSSSVSTAIAIHTLSKHQTQHPFKRTKGLAQTVCFHPNKPLFFVATRQRVRIYDLQQQKLEKELQPGARWISAIALHPLGSNLLVASYDRRLLWHDLDLGSTPYKTLRYHQKAIRSVKFHPSLPLFVDGSDDGTLQVFHGKVIDDGLENATVVPLKVLRGHQVRRELGVLDVEWHPREAWCVSAGADGVCRLWM